MIVINICLARLTGVSSTPKPNGRKSNFCGFSETITLLLSCALHARGVCGGMFPPGLGKIR